MKCGPRRNAALPTLRNSLLRQRGTSKTRETESTMSAKSKYSQPSTDDKGVRHPGKRMGLTRLQNLKWNHHARRGPTAQRFSRYARTRQ